MFLNEYDIGKKRPSLLVRVGSKFLCDNCKYILSHVAANGLSLVNVDNGSMLVEPIYVNNIHNVSESELKKMLGNFGFHEVQSIVNFNDY